MADDSDMAPGPELNEASTGRQRWPGRVSFVMAAIGSAVGLGNVWRFPAVAYANGGGAFFIPYFVALLTAGIPLLILEFAVGQMMQGSAPKSLKKLNRNFEWVGWFAIFVGIMISVYYAAIMAYSWDYLWYSLSTSMPWSAGGEGTEGAFFEEEFLQASATGLSMWGLRLPVVIGLALTWIAVFLIIYKGVHRVGKIVLITVPLPWVLLVVLALRGLTLEGASAGIEYYLRPDFDALKKPATWLAAYGQVFFSLSIGFGIMIAYASYRPRKSDVTNNAFITSFANCLTSYLAGFAVFSVLGFLAFKRGLPVDEVVAGGPGLAFVTYPAAITKMGDLGAIWPPVVGFLFFVTLLSLGIDSLFSIVEAAGAGFQDRYPRVKRMHVAAVMCIASFVAGLLFCTRGGIMWLDLFDHWASNYGLVLVGLLECLLIGYFFTTHRVKDFADDVSEVRLSGWWELCIKVITPAVLVYLLAQNLIGEFTSPYGSAYPVWMTWAAKAVFFGLILGALAITRKWSYLALAGMALVMAIVIYGVVRPASADPEAKVAALETAGGSPREVRFEAGVSGTGDAVAAWEFGDGQTSDELSPTHTYAAAGSYKAKVTVRGRGGKGPAAKAELEVHARPLELVRADLARSRTVAGRRDPLAYRFRAKADFGRGPYEFRWDFGDGGTSREAEGEHTYEAPGGRVVTLTVVDGSPEPQKAEKEFTVEVAPLAVVLRADHRGGEVPAVVDLTAELYNIRSERVEDGPFRFAWDFGDGETSEARFQARHRYDLATGAEPKTLSAGVTVTGPSGKPVSDTVELHLRPPEEHFPWRAALLGAVGGTLLMGGLLLCVLIAFQHHRKGPPGFEEEAEG